MTKLSWLPDLDDFKGPRYIALADALERDIEKSELVHGTRLPTHRDLAWELGVTVGTVTRGYSEATRRGLISGEVGRGTYVQADSGNRPHATPFTWPTSEAIGRNAINMATNSVPMAGQERKFADDLRELTADPQFAEHLIYPPNVGRADVRRAAAEWIAQTTGLSVEPERTFVTSGAQHALTAAFHLVAKPGDTVLVEKLTYPGIKATARTMQVRLAGVEMDEHGLMPDSLDAACRSHHPKLLCCVPTLQNPSGSVMPEERRQEIAEVADRHGVPILEDGIYDFLNEHQPRPIMTWAQTPGFFATGLSKAISPALRTGFLVTPEGQSDEMTRIMAATSLHAPLLMTELARRWMESGDVALFEATVREEARTRQALARKHLKGLEFNAHPNGFHIWLTLPEPWRPTDFARAAERQGLIVTPAESFAIGRDTVPFAVRLSITGPMTHEDLITGLDLVANMARDAPPSIGVVV